jgi:hypothetical protein
MTSAIRIAVAAALSFTSITLAHAQSADAEKRQVVALADTGAVRWSDVEESTDGFAGRYVAADGKTFSITVGDDELTLEAPEGWGPSLLTLHAVGPLRFAADGADIQVTFTFAFAGDGEVSGASIVRASEQAVATTREALRGIVTILDSSEEIATAGLRRGVVTIIDVVNDFATSAVASTAIASAN